MNQSAEMDATDHDRQTSDYDLVVIGGMAAGLSLAISSQRSGLRVRVVEAGLSVAYPELVGREALDVGYDEPVEAIELPHDEGSDGDHVVVRTSKRTYTAAAAAVTVRAPDPAWTPEVTIPADGSRIHVDAVPVDLVDRDVLVVGNTDHAVEIAAQLAGAGGRVVLAAAGLDAKLLSPAGDNVLRTLERERKATVLYRGALDSLAIVDGFPVAYFDGRMTPDLEFDHVVFAGSRVLVDPSSVGLTDEVAASGRIWFVGSESEAAGRFPVADGFNIGRRIAEALFPQVDLTPELDDIAVRQRLPGVVDELRAEHYNATITKFEPTHSDLWVLRVRPDGGRTSHIPGQYASLGLGYWEERIDDVVDPGLDDKWFKLVRRSYSISCRIFDERGYLAADTSGEELEFYIVLVPPSDGHVPGLTPRLALKRPGDRIYLGPKVTGRYTLSAVDDPASTVRVPVDRHRRGPAQRDGGRAAVEGPLRADRFGRHGPPLGRSRVPRQTRGAGGQVPQLPLPAVADAGARRPEALHPGRTERRHVPPRTRGRTRSRDHQRLPVRQPGHDRSARGRRRRRRPLPGARGCC